MLDDPGMHRGQSARESDTAFKGKVCSLLFESIASKRTEEKKIASIETERKERQNK